MSDRTALLVIDVQRIYMEPDPMVTIDGDDLIAKCRGLIDRSRGAGVPVIYVRHHDKNHPDDEALVGIHPEIAPLPGEPVVVKTFGSAFLKTDLSSILEDLGAKRLVICGLATFGCVNASVTCAACKEYDVVVASNAHGTVASSGSSPEEIFAYFHDTWERLGATLTPASQIEF